MKNYTKRRNTHYCFFYFLLITVLCSCGGKENKIKAITEVIVPYQYEIPKTLEDGWQVNTLNFANIDESRLTLLMNDIQKKQFTGIDSIVLVRHNQLIFDELLRTRLDSNRDPIVGNTDLAIHSAQSVSKSFASALIGIAIELGYINSVDDNILDYFSDFNESTILNWDERKKNITIRDFLTMRHGFEWDEWGLPYSNSNNSLIKFFNSVEQPTTEANDWAKALFNYPIANDPGQVFAYSTGVSMVISVLLENATGMSSDEFSRLYLFEPLGITSAAWELLPQANMGGGLFISSRDMAKFGQLFLQKGQWQDQQIIPENWVEESTSQQLELPQYNNWNGYGLHWWRNNFEVNGNTVKTFHAEGNGGQFIYVIPEFDLVVIFTGKNHSSSLMYQPLKIMQDYILPAIN